MTDSFGSKRVHRAGEAKQVALAPMKRRPGSIGATALLAVVCGVGLVAVDVGVSGESGVRVIGPGWTQKKPEKPADAKQIAATPAIWPVPANVPVGSVMAWLKQMTNTPALPLEWVECNGQTLDLPGSPYDGLTIPDLNGATNGLPARFLRGATQSGGTGGSETHTHDGFLVNRAAPRVVNISARSPASNLPPYYDVVWIMKVR